MIVNTHARSAMELFCNLKASRRGQGVADEPITSTSTSSKVLVPCCDGWLSSILLLLMEEVSSLPVGGTPYR